MKMLRLLVVLTIACGLIYPLLVTGISMVFFADKAGGSLVKQGETLIGSSLLAQKITRNDLFHPRPSAADFATVASGASQAAPIQTAAIEQREKRRALMPTAGIDAWTTSGSGLDPHISPKTAYAQVQRIALARGASAESLTALIDKMTENTTFGIWGQPRVNVLELNMELLKGNNALTR